MRRELRDVRTDQVYGALIVDGDRVRFDRGAGDVLRTWRQRVGDDQTARMVMADGWSNGYVYFAEPTP